MEKQWTHKKKYHCYKTKVNGKKPINKHNCIGEYCMQKQAIYRSPVPTKGEECARCYELSLKKFYIELKSKDFKLK